MEEKIYELNEIRDQIQENDSKGYQVIYYEDSYCMLYSGDKFYYIQEEYFGGVNVTLYNKISPNEKRQADYPRGVKNFNDLLNYITETKNKHFNNLEDTYNQVIFHELKTIENGETLESCLFRTAGYREKYILSNLDYIRRNREEEKYTILEFVDKEGNNFMINAKDRNRLIIN